MPAAAFLLAAALLGGMHDWRARRVAQAAARRVRAEMLGLAAERERAARELHDLLLQGVTGLVLNFQVALNRLPADSAERLSMQAMLDAADRCVDEARARVATLHAEPDGSGNST